MLEAILIERIYGRHDEPRTIVRLFQVGGYTARLADCLPIHVKSSIRPRGAEPVRKAAL
jgi:hypothetical protein